MSNRFLEILPSNSNASFSYREGRPVITFNIAEQDAILKPKTIRFCGRFHAYRNSAREAVVAPTAAGVSLAMDSRIGIWSIIDQVVLSSSVSKQQIETVRHANRFYSTYLGVTSSESQLVGSYGEMGLSLPSREGQQFSVVQEGAGLNSNEFCINVPTGLTSGTDELPLSQEWGIGGLTMEIHLAPDSMVLFDTGGDPATNGFSSAFYELTQVKMVCEVHDPSPMEVKSISDKGALEYNSITGYYSTINSTNATLNFSLGLSRVSSVFMNFIPSAYLNNLAQNSLQTLQPTRANGEIADLSQVVFTKGGSRYPLDYNIDTIFRKDPTQKQVDGQVARNFMNAVLPFTKISHTSVSPVNTNKTWTTNDNLVLEGGSLYGVGVAYDILGSAGADFSREAWGAQMDVAINDNNPVSAFIFVHHKNTLLYRSGQVQVNS